MSDEKKNGGEANRGGLDDPFARGVWILTTLSGADAICMVDGTEGDEQESMKRILAELAEHRSLRCDLTKKYLLKEICFPMPHPKGAGHGLVPGSLPSVSRHESTIEMVAPFPTHATITSFTFLREIDPEDVERLRMSVRNADESAEINARMMRSNLVTPAGAGLAP